MRLPSLFGRRPSPADLPPVTVPATHAAAPKPGPAPVRAVLTPPPTPATDQPAPPFHPGRYAVTYDRRIGPASFGSPLIAVADSAADLAEQIRDDIAPFLGPAHRIEVTVDTVVNGGMIRAGSVKGTFTYTRGGAR